MHINEATQYHFHQYWWKTIFLLLPPPTQTFYISFLFYFYEESVFFLSFTAGSVFNLGPPNMTNKLVGALLGLTKLWHYIARLSNQLSPPSDIEPRKTQSGLDPPNALLTWGPGKKSHTWLWRRWGTLQNFCLTFTDELEKQLFIKKNCWSGPTKNSRIIIFTTLHFFKKNKEKHLDISLFYTCVPKISTIYSSGDIECDRLNW